MQQKKASNEKEPSLHLSCSSFFLFFSFFSQHPITMFIFKKKKVNEDKVFPDDSSSTKSERKKAPFAALPTTRLISERLLNAVVDKTTITAATLSRPNTDYQPDFLNSSKSYVLSNKYVDQYIR